MQLNSIYLYPNLINVYLNLSSAWQIERYRNVYNRNLKVFRGGDNRIDLQIKNSDQKATSIAGYIPVYIITNRFNEQILKKDATIISAESGRAYVVLNQNELQNIDKGFYNYSVLLESRESSGTDYVVTERKPGYMDSQYGALATLEIFGDLSGEPTASKQYKNFSLVKPSSVGEEAPTYYFSDLIDAEYEINNSNSLHTFVFYMNGYSGTVEIQASLEEGATPKNWINVSTIQYNNRDLAYHNVEGKWKWFRIKHIPGKVSTLAEFTIAQTITTNYEVSIRNPGAGYAVGNKIVIVGSRLGGERPAQNLTITVESVDMNGRIQTISWEGNSYPGFKTYVLSPETLEIGTIDKVLYR